MANRLTKADAYLYSDIIAILNDGNKDKNPRPKYKDGTPAHTLSVNHNFRIYDIANGQFPICTLRKQAWKTAIKEILAIYQKQVNTLEELEQCGVSWWKDFDIGDGTIGNRYGHTVCEYELIDKLIADIKSDPYGRRHIMNLWQEEELRSSKGLAPCAYETIWNVRCEHSDNEEYLDMILIQRSGDMLVASGAGGVNEIQYACLLLMIAKVTGYKVGRFSHVVANEQIYDRHFKQADELLDRYEQQWDEELLLEELPYIALETDKEDFYEFDVDDFKIYNYKPLEPQLEFELGI